MKTFKIVLIVLTIGMGLSNIVFGLINSNTWQGIAGIWQLIAGANWLYDSIPNDLVEKKEEVK